MNQSISILIKCASPLLILLVFSACESNSSFNGDNKKQENETKASPQAANDESAGINSADNNSNKDASADGLVETDPSNITIPEVDNKVDTTLPDAVAENQKNYPKDETASASSATFEPLVKVDHVLADGDNIRLEGFADITIKVLPDQNRVRIYSVDIHQTGEYKLKYSILGDDGFGESKVLENLNSGTNRPDGEYISTLNINNPKIRLGLYKRSIESATFDPLVNVDHALADGDSIKLEGFADITIKVLTEQNRVRIYSVDIHQTGDFKLKYSILGDDGFGESKVLVNLNSGTNRPDEEYISTLNINNPKIRLGLYKRSTN